MTIFHPFCFFWLMNKRINSLHSSYNRLQQSFQALTQFTTTIGITMAETQNIKRRPICCMLNPTRQKSTSVINNHISSVPESYEDAIKVLNTLQSNSKTLRIWREKKPTWTKESAFAEMVRTVERSGLSISQMETLNVIHVAGTKGKGTTCAFVESILRESGLRTGFFSSPHLVAVRERIRIDGKPISTQKFTKYFFHVFHNLENTKKSDEDMPPYFRFLTSMGLYAFYHEKVDVVILEVGIGGTFDATNVFRQPIVTGITSLGLDHQNVLGNTLQEITKSKAGIMKQDVPCFTLTTHPPFVQQILEEEAGIANCPLYTVPSLDLYRNIPNLGVDDGEVIRLNAALALQLANTFLLHKYPQLLKKSSQFEFGKPFTLSNFHIKGLQNCVWPGRFQVIQRNSKLKYFLDGAHTVDSLEAAKIWFTKSTVNNNTQSHNVLVFGITGERDAKTLLKQLTISNQFQLGLFCSFITYPPSADNWSALQEGECDKMLSLLSSIWQEFCPQVQSQTFNSVNHVIEYLDKFSEEKETNVLITGSMHLVGLFLSLLDPELKLIGGKL